MTRGSELGDAACALYLTREALRQAIRRHGWGYYVESRRDGYGRAKGRTFVPTSTVELARAWRRTRLVGKNGSPPPSALFPRDDEDLFGVEPTSAAPLTDGPEAA